MKKYSVLLICIIILVSCRNINAPSKNQQNQTIYTTQTESSQISTEALKSLSTNELINTLYNVPIMKDVYKNNTPKTDITQIMNESNELQELLTREDISLQLLAEYKKLRDGKGFRPDQVAGSDPI